MKYCRFQYENKIRYGIVEPVAGKDAITHLLPSSPEELGGDLESITIQSLTPISLLDAVLLEPVRPSKIVCVGRNYREHIAEMGHDVPTEPMLFFKPPSALLPPGGTVRRLTFVDRTDHEGELGIVIGRRCSKLKPDEDVRPYILGYTCVNDVSARDLQKKDGQWARAKGFDTSCPVGPVVTTQLDPWAGVSVKTRVNGQVRQDGTTLDLIFPVDAIIRHIARVMTLLPGDLIATGTPSGVGPIVAGDIMEVEIAGIGILRNQVADEIV